MGRYDNIHGDENLIECINGCTDECSCEYEAECNKADDFIDQIFDSFEVMFGWDKS